MQAPETGHVLPWQQGSVLAPQETHAELEQTVWVSEQLRFGLTHMKLFASQQLPIALHALPWQHAWEGLSPPHALHCPPAQTVPADEHVVWFAKHSLLAGSQHPVLVHAGPLAQQKLPAPPQAWHAPAKQVWPLGHMSIALTQLPLSQHPSEVPLPLHLLPGQHGSKPLPHS
jgi:hypothetical protein